ncbi:hypothetical protein MZM54_01865 [[Brevibacterium] frigoritolerans]|nr:hypothetical protein [Peribacillus frigoritolerans]
MEKDIKNEDAVIGEAIKVEKEIKIGDSIISGQNEYKLINIYLDERIYNGYTKLIGLYSEQHNEVIAANRAYNATEYMNNLKLEWVRRK